MKYLLLILSFTSSFLFAQTNTNVMIKKGVDTTKYIPTGLGIGEKAPVIETFSSTGELINSKNILQEKELVVIFYRGEWCPVCNRYLQNLNDSLDYIYNKNAEILVIGPETFDNAEKTIKKSEGSFTLIPDTTAQILMEFDVLFSVTKKYQKMIKTFLRTDIAESNNQEEAQLPVPATYIIGKNGLIKWRHFDYNYSERASVKEILDNLE